MAELAQSHDLTAPVQSGWVVLHEVHRDDGELVFVRVQCTTHHHRLIRAEADRELNAVLADRGRRRACETAEKIQPGRGPTEVQISLRPGSMGGLIVSYRYARQAAEAPAA